tara:strand:+ start:3848 stop:5515 length:1668 start_codon:yes stop_codon:yes gene_type:complete
MSIANLFSQVSPENRYYNYDREIMEDYDNRINIYNDALNKYKTEAGDYQSLADAHNTRINDYNDSLTAYRENADAYNAAINRFNEGPRTTPYADVDYYVGSPGEFLSTAPVFEGGARPVAPEDPGFSGADVDEFVEQAGKRATDRGRANAAALNVFAQSGNYATAPMINNGAGVSTIPEFSFSSNSFAKGGVVPGMPGLTQRAIDMYRGPRGIISYMEEGGEVESFFDRFHPLRGSYRRKKPVSVKAVEAALDFTPLGTLKTGVEIYDESKQEDPNYAKMGIMAAAEAAGYIPFAGPAIKKMVKGGLDNLDLNFNKVNQNKIFNQDVDNLIISGKELGIPTEKINKDILDYAKLKKKPHPKRAFDNPKVEYVDTKTIVDNVAQLNLPRYDVGKFGGDLPTGKLVENPDKLDEFIDSGDETLKENIFNEGFKEPIEIEISLSDGGVLMSEGHHRLQAAIELGIDEVPVVFKTKENPLNLVPVQKPAKVDVSGLKTSTNYSFSDIDFENRILSPKESAKEIQERGGTVFMGENDTFSDRKSSKYYTPMREGYYRKTE